MASTLSLGEIIANQERLEEEAAEAIPFSFSNCTYEPPINETRQPVYSCLSCRGDDGESGSGAGLRAGICAGCSVACHGDCELVELFTRRNFTCDCGTDRIPKRKCTITLRENEAADRGNRYDDNFDGVFCSCRIRYDPETEEDEMVQCLFCENWFHTNKCLSSGRDVLHADAFDTFVCEGCVLSDARETIGRYAGSSSFMLLNDDGTFLGRRSGTHEPSQPFSNSAIDARDATSGGEGERGSSATLQDSVLVSSSSSLPRSKREASPTDERDTSVSKRHKADVQDNEEAVRHEEEDPCSAPPSVHNPLLDGGSPTRKNIFLEKDWRDKLCQCMKCMPHYTKYPFLLEEETVYEPPEDPDSTKSLLELGTDALSKMPREQAIRGLQAYATMKDKLSAFLTPFARDGRVVSKEDMDGFFAEQRELQQQR